MAEGGRLEAACRHTYETLLLRSRGYGMSKAVLEAVAQEEGLNLTALVGRLGRTPGAIRDYLLWLLGVDALRMVRKRYFYVDGARAPLGPPPRPRDRTDPKGSDPGVRGSGGAPARVSLHPPRAASRVLHPTPSHRHRAPDARLPTR